MWRYIALSFVFLISICNSLLCNVVVNDTKNMVSEFDLSFNTSSLEKIVLSPEKINKNSKSFWQNDEAYSLIEKWHNRENLKLDRSKWEENLSRYISVLPENRKENLYLNFAYKLKAKEAEFKRKAIPFLLSFFPKDMKKVKTQIFLVEETFTGGFIQDGNVIIDVTHNTVPDIDATFNMLIHELFHIGFEKFRLYRKDYPLKNNRLDRVLDLLQNEGIATYVGYKAKKIYDIPDKKIYILLKSRENLPELIKDFNEYLDEIIDCNDEEFYKKQNEIGYEKYAYYLLGAYMVEKIDKILGREVLISTILRGPRTFVSAYNSIAQKNEKIYEFPQFGSINLADKLKKAYLEKRYNDFNMLKNKLLQNKEDLGLEEESQINILGYIMIMNNDIENAIDILQLNTCLFPNSYNAYDSLGEVFYLNGDKEKALESYQKSLSINPKNKNAEKFIEKLIIRN